MDAPKNHRLATSKEIPQENPAPGYTDEQNPLSLWQKLGPYWTNKFKDCLALCDGAELLLHDETVFQKWILEAHNYRPGLVENRYRISFWHEYENACREERLMRMTNVFQLIGNEVTFGKLIMGAPERACWLLVRPMRYENIVEEMLAKGMERMRKALEQDPMVNPLKPDTKLLSLQFKIMQWMDLRRHGAPTQKVQQLNLHANVGPGDDVKQLTEKGDMGAIQERLEKLKARKAAAEGRHLPPPAELAGPAPEGTILEAEVVPAVKK